MTTWKVIIGFPKYSVSDDGRVRNNKTGKILTPYPDTNGYLTVGLYRDSKRTPQRIHRLVAEAFIRTRKGTKRSIGNRIKKFKQRMIV